MSKEKGNLVLSRKPGESFFIGDDVEVTLLRMERDRVHLRITAPKSVNIRRAELPLKPKTP